MAGALELLQHDPGAFYVFQLSLPLQYYIHKTPLLSGPISQIALMDAMDSSTLLYRHVTYADS